jgi:hypothetical protein
MKLLHKLEKHPKNRQKTDKNRQKTDKTADMQQFELLL